MRILTSEQFENEPIGTVYCLWEPNAYINNACIKGTEIAEHSWWDLSLLPWGKDEYEPYEINTDIETEGFCTDDAIYNHRPGQLWCVFNKAEVNEMINRLQDALKGIVDQENDLQYEEIKQIWMK